MNTLDHLNKVVGVVFAAALVAYGGYHALCWRQRMGDEAKQRMQRRLTEIAEEHVTAFQIPANAPFTPQTNPDYWKNFQGSAVLPMQTFYSPSAE